MRYEQWPFVSSTSSKRVFLDDGSKRHQAIFAWAILSLSDLHNNSIMIVAGGVVALGASYLAFRKVLPAIATPCEYIENN